MSVPLSMQARETTRKTYRATAVAECKKAFMNCFPRAFKTGGKGIKMAQAKKLQGAQVLTLMHAQGKSGGRSLMSCLVSFHS